MHWIGAHFCVCMCLDFRNKSLNMLNFVETIKEDDRTKEEQREHFFSPSFLWLLCCCDYWKMILLKNRF